MRTCTVDRHKGILQKPQKATHHVSALFELSGQVEGTSCVVFYTETI